MSLTRVEPPLLGADALDQLFDLCGDQMIDANRDAVAAGCGNQLGGVLDGLGPGVFGLAVAGRAAGDVDRRPRCPSSTAMPRPAPRVAPATKATLPASDIDPS
jgi:hypothetical protein